MKAQQPKTWLRQKHERPCFHPKSKRPNLKVRSTIAFAVSVAAMFGSSFLSTAIAETFPYNPKFQVTYRNIQLQGQFLGAETAFELAKFGKVTAFLDAEVQAEKQVIQGLDTDFQFASSRFASGVQYKDGNTLLVEGRAYATALPTYKGLGVKGYIGRNWGANRFSLDGYWQTGKRRNFDVEGFTTPGTDENGNPIEIPNFRIVERFDPENEGELNTNLFLTGGFLPNGMRISANGRLFRRTELFGKRITRYAQANVQQDFGSVKRFSPRSKFEFNGVHDSTFETRAYGRLHYALIDKQKFQAQVIPGLQYSKSIFADEPLYSAYAGARVRWLPTSKNEVTGELEVIKNLNGGKFLTYNFQGIHTYRFANNWQFRSNVFSSRFANQISATYEPHLIWNKIIANKAELNVDLNGSYGKNFSTKAISRAVGLNLSLRPRFDAKVQYEFLLNGRINWLENRPTDRRLEVGLRINF